MSTRLTETQVSALQRAIADGSLPPGALHAMMLGPAPVSASGRRQTADLSDAAVVLPMGDGIGADRSV